MIELELLNRIVVRLQNEKMCRLSDLVYRPNPQNAPIYDELYEKYRTLHDYFGRGGNPVMSELKTLARRAKENKN